MLWAGQFKVAPDTPQTTLALVSAADLEKKPPARQSLVSNTCNPFYAGLRILGRVYRFVGCFFLENLGSTSFSDVKAKRISWYLLYPVCMWYYLLMVGVVLFAESERHKDGMRPADQLNKGIFIICVLLMTLEGALNNILLLLQAPKLVKLVQTCELFELNTAVPPYVHRQTVRFAWTLVLYESAVIVQYIAVNTYSDFGTAILVDEGREVDIFTYHIAISYSLLGVPCLAVMCTSTRLLMMYFSQTFTLYLGCITMTLDRCLRSRTTPETSKVFLVDHMRVQLHLLKDCADIASSILGPSLLYGYAYSVAILCASAYYTIISELKFCIRVFFSVFGFFHWISILLPAIIDHRMKCARQYKDDSRTLQVTELRNIVQGMPLEDYSQDLLLQITMNSLHSFLYDENFIIVMMSETVCVFILHMLLHAIKKDDLHFSACGFFIVDLSTFADIMGAVITYTVLLVQTNETYLRGSREVPTGKVVA